MSAKLSQLEFAYNDPEPGFDRSKVKSLRGKSFLHSLSICLPFSIYVFFLFVTPSFSRTTLTSDAQVHGLVAELISVKNPSATTALEIAAGGRLYHVVVDSEHTGKMLLEKGGLKRRVTIIPLNRIAARTTEDGVVRLAQKEVRERDVDEWSGRETEREREM